MPQKPLPQDRGLKFLRLKKVVTLAQLAVQLRCSPRTVQRRLAEWQAIHSYNENGRYYTLRDIPKFDANGLWRYGEAFFSRFGNLPQTFVQLVQRAPAGLTAAEVGQLLGLRPSSFLWAFRDYPGVKRERDQGPYVYFASDPARYAEQRPRRALLSQTSALPTEFEAVAILVEKIKHPAWSIAQLCRRLRNRKLRVEPESIQTLFARHGLGAKKKPPSA